MQSSKAFKAACLTVGLATAWSPVGTPAAKGDTVSSVSVNFHFGSTPDQIFLFKHVYVGISFTTGAPLIQELTGAPLPGDGINEFDYSASFDDSHAPSAFSKFVLVGLTGTGSENVSFTHVVSSISSPPSLPFQWSDVFAAEEPTVAADLAAGVSAITPFITTILGDPYVAKNVSFDLDNPELASMYAFSGALGVGDSYVTVSPASAVPLPPGVIMGGALLALLASGKRGAAWVRARAASNISCV